MELTDIIAEFRRRADDAAAQPFYDDDAIAKWASEAEREACIRARLLFDDSTADVTQYAIAIGQAIVQLHPSIDVIASASFTPDGSTRVQQMDLVGIDYVKEQCDWSTRTSNRPCHLVHLDRGQARIWPTPSIAGTLNLEVYRLPLYDLEDDGDEPEIDSDHHEGLLDWVLFRAYSVKDGELGDPSRASAALADFTDRFGERPDADSRRRQRERRRVTTRCL